MEKYEFFMGRGLSIEMSVLWTIFHLQMNDYVQMNPKLLYLTNLGSFQQILCKRFQSSAWIQTNAFTIQP